MRPSPSDWLFHYLKMGIYLLVIVASVDWIIISHDPMKKVMIFGLIALMVLSALIESWEFFKKL